MGPQPILLQLLESGSMTLFPHWIGRRGRVEWAPRSPDLSPLLEFNKIILFQNVCFSPGTQTLCVFHHVLKTLQTPCRTDFVTTGQQRETQCSYFQNFKTFVNR